MKGTESPGRGQRAGVDREYIAKRKYTQKKEKKVMTLAMTKLYLMLTNLFLAVNADTAVGADDGKGDKVMSGFLSVIATVARYAGIGLAAIGLYQFVHALQEGDGQGKGRAVLFIIAGAAMFLMKTLLNAVFSGV